MKKLLFAALAVTLASCSNGDGPPVKMHGQGYDPITWLAAFVWIVAVGLFFYSRRKKYA